MINLGRIRISNNGKYIRGVKYQNAIRTGILLSFPIVIFNALLIPIFQLFYLQYPIIIINVMLIITVISSITYTSVIDPGILPPEKLQEHYNNKLQQIFEKRINKKSEKQDQDSDHTSEQTDKMKLSAASSVIDDSLYFNAINQQHDQESQYIELKQKGHHAAFKYCSTCRFFRPLRSVHSTMSNVCIQRYDHFCDWIGTDIGLHNHASFIVMIYVMLCSSIIQAVLNVLGAIFSMVVLGSCYQQGRENICNALLINKIIFVRIQPWYGILGLCVSVAFVVINGLFTRAIHQLIKYHMYLLRTGTLTKEDSRNQNTELNQMYNTFSLFGNFCLLLKNNAQNEPKILHLYCKHWNNIVKEVQHNQTISNFSDLANFLKENGYQQQFTIQNNQGKSVTNSRLLMMSEVNDEDKVKLHIKQVEVYKLLTRISCFEFAINRSKNMVQYSRAQIDLMAARNPELFSNQNDKINLEELQLLELCQKAKQSAYQKANKTFSKHKGDIV